MHDWPPGSAIATFADGDPGEDPWVCGPLPTQAIEIADYSSEWPALFEASKARITRALAGVALHVEHVGSTAVPGLAAKPILDIDLIVEDPTREETYVPALGALGYVLTIRERTWYEHRMLRHERSGTHLHVFGPRCPEHARHVLFRDWLREHPQDRARYVDAKQAARIGASDGWEYNRRKEAVVRDIYGAIFRSRGWTPA